MKTELITNVSHDIKTPLTSIVNYVDLLEKEDIQPEKAKEYVDVLHRQSARLKKLTEDLVEASKASSGCLPVHLARTDVNVLLSQLAGDYLEKARGRAARARVPSRALAAEDPGGRAAAVPGAGESVLEHLQIRHARHAGIF